MIWKIHASLRVENSSDKDRRISMKLTGNTIFITGGGSGIGRGLAEELHKLGNQVIISGRRKGHLEEVCAANAGMAFVELDVEDSASIAAVAAKLIADYPKLNVLINNAGIMLGDNVSNVVDDAVIVSTITTNLIGPIRMTSALIEHLKKQEYPVVATVTSGLAFIPLALNAVYSATKAAIHSYTLSLRFRLKGTGVKVIEIAPPYVQTELTGEHQKNDPHAMPLDRYIAETMRLLGTDADDVMVENVMERRKNQGPNEWGFVDKFNDLMVQQRGS
jgi:uncharacterized oxidoreductase